VLTPQTENSAILYLMFKIHWLHPISHSCTGQNLLRKLQHAYAHFIHSSETDSTIYTKNKGSKSDAKIPWMLKVLNGTIDANKEPLF